MKLKYKIYVLTGLFLILIVIAFLSNNEILVKNFTSQADFVADDSIYQNQVDHSIKVKNFDEASFKEISQTKNSNLDDGDDENIINERIYKFELEQNMKVEFPVPEGLFRYSIVDNDLYFVDQSHQIWKLNLNSLIPTKLVETGKAPHENQNVSSVMAYDEELYIVDIDKRSFRRQDFDGNVIKQDLKLNYITYNGIYLNKNYGISLRDDKANSAFEVYNFDSSKIQKEYNLVELFNLKRDQDFAEIITEGYFIGDFDIGTIYMPGRFGEFIMFDSLGDIKYRGSTIDGTQKPRVKTEKVFGNSYMYVREPDYYVNYSASMNSKILIILSLDGEKSSHTNLDVYSVTTGEYLGTAKIDRFSEERPKEVILTNEDVVWVLFENYTFVKYNLNEDEV
jgi:hypothetical protein